MGNLLFIYNRKETAVNRVIFDSIFSKPNNSVSCGEKTIYCKNSAMGVKNFWTTPEDYNKDQISESKYYNTCFHGRIDNRTDLLNNLNISPSLHKNISDNELFNNLFSIFGAHSFDRILGSFIVSIYDKVKEHAIIARDKAGNRKIVYYLDSNIFIASNDEQSILKHPEVSRELDQTTVARFLDVSIPYHGKTFFQEISELPPSHYLTINRNNYELKSYYSFDNVRPIRYKNYSDYQDNFEHIINNAVCARLRSITQPSIMMSGGMDSPTVAYFANKNLSRFDYNKPLHTYSFIFNEKFREISEEKYIDSFTNKYNTISIKLNCDNAWPLSKIDSFITNPNTPWDDPYRIMLNRIYESCNNHNNNVLLTGFTGDDLYVNSRNNYLYDLLIDFKFREFLYNLSLTLKNNGIRAIFKDPSIRRIFRFIKKIHKSNNKYIYNNRLTKYSKKLFYDYENNNQKKIISNHLNHSSTYALNIERSYASNYYIDIRFPYRDIRVLEFIINIPNYLLFNENRYKYILRNMMKNKLPHQILNRKTPTNLSAIYLHGLKMEKEKIRSILYNNNSLWTKYIDKNWLSNFEINDYNTGDSAQNLVIWRCISLEIWRKKYYYI